MLFKFFKSKAIYVMRRFIGQMLGVFSAKDPIKYLIKSTWVRSFAVQITDGRV